MILVTKAQLSKIHVLLSQLQLMDEKANFVSQFSNGRVSSSAKMTMQEATELLKYLSNYDPNNRMRKKVFALAYVAGIIWGDTQEDKRMNSVKLNSFLKERGAVKKELNKMSKAELIKVVNQFELIIKHKGESAANKSAASVLSELNIVVEKKHSSHTN